ncbi:membrane protein [Tannerella sp. oral taxon BU063 isolate Cell 5]|uniref:Probable queuosine precursor transporter n=1 Tax=Tannerella sp. oral taxon BU063 isolate Cell 5 TaxID=1410950 RepID=W2CB53_9BACT|nr:membrane protein [Tannerella sp. oral taxon BU063 isolate Cell 5]
MKSKVSVSFMMLGVLFCTCLVASNLLETKVVRLWQMPGGHILSVTAGLLVFPVSYIINDCIAEVWGYRKARLIIWLGFAMNFLVIILSRVAVMLPAAPFWEGEEAFNFVFGLAPRIAAASLLAFLVGSFLNAYVMSRMKIRSAGRNFSARAILSTLVGESADSLLFFPIAFGGIIPADELLKMIAVQALLKTLYEILILPVTIRVVHYIKRVDETDTYDEGISYNVWKIKEL